MARYNPGPSTNPSGLTVTSTGDGEVSLNWTDAYNAAAYTVYYATSQGVKKTSGTKFATTTSTSAVVTGLKNDTVHYFVVTSVNSSGESSESNEVSATPSVPGPFTQADMTGTWRFNILVSGANAGWMRGTLTVDDTGAVTFVSFLNSAGGTTAPAYLFPLLLLNPTGHARDAVNADDAKFMGVMATRRNILVGNMSPDSGSRMIAVLQKHDAAATFSTAGDLNGFGNAAGGARRFVYSQISSGSVSEWEYAVGQLGQTPDVQYSTFSAPSSPVTPGSKATRLSVTSAGIVSEANSSGSPKPTVLIPAGVMSDDKTVIVATATDTSSGSKYILRIYQLINVVASDTNSLTLADLAGAYNLNQLAVGATPLWASSLLTLDSSGGAVFSDFLDSSGGTTPPSAMNLAIDTVPISPSLAMPGILTNAADATFHGKLSYFKDMVIFTRTEPGGLYSLSIVLK
ncbi:MAG: hypothetical protein EG824_06930 [Deltaproteobacteria bacterium]|nr:hypothetical protein [Deltaproteobacteria bacterium]